MKVTANMMKKLGAAKDAGYKRVYAVVGGFKGTTYCRFFEIDHLLKMGEGYETAGGKPMQCRGMWTGHPNTRHATAEDIQYKNLYSQF